jgi:hypothetical protein
VTPATPLACPSCGHEQEFAPQPLYCLAGPSGTGKSTVGRALLPRVSDRFVVLEQDVLWVPELRDPTDRPVLLCGTVVPPELEPLPERALFSRVHYLALTCRADILAARLRARPAWREWDEPRIAETLEYAAWLERNAATVDPPVALLDTTERSIDETAAAVQEWLTARHHRD